MSSIIGSFEQAKAYISSHPSFYPAAFVETIQNFGGVPQYLVYMKLDSDDPDALEQAAFYSALYTISMETIGSFSPPSDDPNIDADIVVPLPESVAIAQPNSPEAHESDSEEAEGEEQEGWESMDSGEQEGEEEYYSSYDDELSTDGESYDHDEGAEEEEEGEEEEDELPLSPAPAG
jgi:hypothetical protein